MSLKKTIGTNAFSYPELRNFAGHDFENYTFRKVMDFYKFPAFLLFKLRNKINRKWLNSFLDFGLNRCDFFHFFNVISKGNKPFITTYETSLPRWNDTESDFKKGLELLANKNCMQIIALSECAAAKQELVLKKYRPDLYETIMKKNKVLLPPQTPFINTISDKRPLQDKIIFTIVGADFFRKGGIAILNAFETLFNENSPVILNIVSTLNFGDYASKTTEQDFKHAVSFFEKHKENARWHQKLSNEKVIALLLDTDVALLPSIAETFGYFILEAQAAGCPVITSDIRAMPEINNDSKGWLINIKTDAYDADLQQLDTIYAKIESELIKTVLAIVANPSIVKIKGELALNDIKTKHSPKKHRETLEAIYDKLINTNGIGAELRSIYPDHD